MSQTLDPTFGALIEGKIANWSRVHSLLAPRNERHSVERYTIRPTLACCHLSISSYHHSGHQVILSSMNCLVMRATKQQNGEDINDSPEELPQSDGNHVENVKGVDDEKGHSKLTGT